MIGLFVVSTVCGLFLALRRVQKQFQAERELRVRYQTLNRRLVEAANGVQPYFACPTCSSVSYSLRDLQEGWCGHCKTQTRKAYDMSFAAEEV